LVINITNKQFKTQKCLQDDVKSEPEETPIVSPAEEESKYPEELFNLATLAEVSLAYAGQLHQSSFTEQINQAR
jgi:hypothetical protein